MVIGLFIITAIPTVTGVCQAISAQQNREKRQKDEKRMKKFNIDIEYTGTSSKGGVIQDGRLVAKDERVWIGPPGIDKEGDRGYVCECMIVEYPDGEVQRNPPLLNWLYVDKDTMEVKYGNKTASIAHHVGCWDWTEDEQFLNLEGIFGKQAEDFVAVKNPSVSQWQLFYDMDGDGLQSYVPKSWDRLQVRLRRTLLPEI